jgi:hypothetical protein
VSGAGRERQPERTEASRLRRAVLTCADGVDSVA